MNSSTISFIAWSVIMAVTLVGLVIAARKSRSVQSQTEDVASRALPEIGEIAEKKHKQRFGRAPTNAPGASSECMSSWYPETKKKVAGKA